MMACARRRGLKPHDRRAVDALVTALECRRYPADAGARDRQTGRNGGAAWTMADLFARP
jgi:hypothetical protein